MTTHIAQGITVVCQGCSEEFCTQCCYGARYSCVYFRDTVPEANWLDAEAYMNSNPDKLERVVRSGPRIRCAVVRVGTTLFRRIIYDNEIVKDAPVLPTETCIYCGSYDRRYLQYSSIYLDGFACTECANGILCNS